MSGPAQNDSGYSTTENTPLVLLPGQLLANDPAGTSILDIGNATGGSVSYDSNGNIVFTPSPDYSGIASFEYLALDALGEISVATVSLTIAETNEAPQAVSDAGFSTAEDTPLFIAGSTLLANDSDGDGDALTITGVADAVGGTAVLDSQGNITFTPQADYNGAASFSYTVSDGNGGFDTATVEISVTPVNDSPVAAGNSYTFNEDTVLTLSPGQLLSNDSDVDGDTLSIAGVSDPVGGTVVIDGQGNVVFTPLANYNGPASFQYAVGDGNGGFATTTVNLTITPVNDKPVVVNDTFTLAEDTPLVLTSAELLANDYDVEGGTLSILAVTAAQNGSVSRDAQGNITFTPTADYNGPASFKYVVSDGQGGFTTGTVNLTVTPVNDAPEGIDSIVNGIEDTAYAFSASDFGYTDVDGDALVEVRIDGLPDPGLGSLTLNGVNVTAGQVIAVGDIGGLLYTPATNVNGMSEFTFSVSDGQLFDPVPNIMTVNVAPVNDAPDAVDDGGSAVSGMSLSSVSSRAATGFSLIGNITAGDFNGDGAMDLYVKTAHGHAGGNGLMFGEDDSLTMRLNGESYAAAASNGPELFKLGADNSFTGMGDVDNDGLADIVKANSGTSLSLLLGDETTPDAIADQTLSQGIGYAGAGAPILADFNGDGHNDLFVGVVNSSSQGNGTAPTSPAMAFWLGNAVGVAGNPTATAYSGISSVGVSSQVNAAFTLGATDLNGDGYADIVTNVGTANDGLTNYGPAKVTFGNAAGSFAANLASSDGGLILGGFDVAGGNPLARSVASGGDFNGDGLQDLAGWNEAGAGGFVLFGDSSMTTGSTVDIGALNGQDGVRFTGTGSAVSEVALGDLNGDGIDDMVVGSQAAASGAGKLWVVWGQEGGFSSGNIDLSQESTGQFITLTGTAGQGIGSALAITDMDGDGLNDLVVGSSTGTIDVVSGSRFEGLVSEPLPGYTTFEDTPLSIDPALLLANDSDIDGDTLTIQSVQDAIGGTVAFDQAGNVIFTPDTNYTGAASFTYTISDGNGGTDTATVRLTVRPDDMSLSSVSSRAATGLSSISLLSAGDFDGDGAVDLMTSTVTGYSGGDGLIFGQAGSLTTRLDGDSFAAAAVNGPEVFKFSSYNNTIGMADINNDGMADVINATSGTTATVRMGDDTAPDNLADQTLSFGIGYSPSGNPAAADFNGDGYADLFMGVANSTSVNGASATMPSLALWLGGSGGISNSPTATAYSGITPVGIPGGGGSNGAYAIGAVDINGDGFDDLVTNVGARNNGYTNFGPVKITFGNAAGNLEQDLSSNAGGLILDNFNFAGGDPLQRYMASGGDVNGDGIGDMAGWAASYPSTATGGFVLFGDDAYAAGGSVDIAALDGQNGVKLTGLSAGISNMALGDLNGDGIDDMVVGSQAAASGAGKLWVVWGQEGGFSSGSIDLSQESTGQFITLTGTAGQGIGSALAITDMDGDGLNDLVVGSSTGTIDVVSGSQFGAGVDSLIGAMAAFSVPADGLEVMVSLPDEQQYQLASPV